MINIVQYEYIYQNNEPYVLRTQKVGSQVLPL